jgi:hypothetical protein
MNIQKLKATLEEFKDNLGESLLSSDIWDTKSGLSIIGYNANEKYVALFNGLTESMGHHLQKLDFSQFGEYQLTDLDNNSMLLLLNFKGEYLWGSLLDKTNLSLGNLFFIAIPKAKIALKKAMLKDN